MPDADLGITATFKDANNQTYTLTVNGGTGSGAYAAGVDVDISADVPLGKLFDKWEGHEVVFENATNKTVTFIMPSEDVIITAVLVDDVDLDTFKIINPSHNSITVDLNSDINYSGTLYLRDEYGRTLQTKIFEIVPGNQKLQLDVSALSTGVYLLQWVTPESDSFKKVLVN